MQVPQPNGSTARGKPGQSDYSGQLHLNPTLALMVYHNPSGNNGGGNQATGLYGLRPSSVVRIQ